MSCLYHRFTKLGASRGRLVAALVFVLLSITLVASFALGQSVAKSHRKIVQMFDPQYPSVLRNGHFEGQVLLDATVLANGNVAKVDIKGGNPILSQYAADAVMKWKYAPGPDKTIEEVAIHFNTSR